MYSGKRQKFDWVFALCLGDVVMVLLSIFVSAFLQHQAEVSWTQVDAPFSAVGPLVIYLVLVFFAMRRSGLYTWATLMDRFLAPMRLLWTFFLVGTAFSLMIALLGLGDCEIYRWVILQVVIGLFFVWLGRLLLRWLMLDVFQVIPQERIAVEPRGSPHSEAWRRSRRSTPSNLSRSCSSMRRR